MLKETTTHIRVRFEECDFYSHVNNAVYMNYLDAAQIDYFRQIFKDPRKTKFLFHLVHASIDYKSSATWDDELVIKTKIETTGNTSITFRQDIQHKNTGEILVEARRIGVFLNKRGKKITVPKEILKHFNN